MFLVYMTKWGCKIKIEVTLGQQENINSCVYVLVMFEFESVSCIVYVSRMKLCIY
jgi:hypothetical protein